LKCKAARITGTGSSTLTSTGTFEMQDGGISVILGGSNIALNKSTTGTVTLSGSNTYSGATSINAGTLVLNGSSGTIASSTGVIIATGATLKLDNTSSANQTNRLKNDATVTMTGGTLDFSNNGGSTNYSETTGALTLSSGTNTIATRQAALNQTSTLTFTSLTRSAGAGVNFVGTGLGVNGRNKILFSTSPTLSNGILGAWATYNGSGFATYDSTSGVKEYSAYTNVSRLSSGSKAIADVAASNVRILEGSGTSGIITLTATVTNINSLFQSSSGGSSAATINTESKTLRFGTSGGILSQSGTGSLTLGTASNSGTVTAGGAANTAGILTISNESANAILINSLIADNGTGTVSLAKGGPGTLTLNGTNSYSGATTVSSGTLQLGHASALGTTATGTTVGNGATLDLNGMALGTEALSLNGAGQNNAGALINSSANSASASGTVALGTASSIGGSGNLTLSGVISGGALTKIGEGTLTLNGTLANAHTGMTTVNAGTLVLGNTVVNGAIPGALTIGDGIGTDSVRIVVEGQIGNSSPVTLNSSGVLELQALTLPFRETIGTLTMTGGSIRTGIGTLYLNGNVTGNASATPATISGNLDLHANGSPDATGVRSFTIADGAATEDMVISAIISDGALSKEGAGTLILSGSNTYTGGTEVNNGMLVVNNNPGSGTGTGVVGIRAGAALGGTGTIEGATSISGTHAPGGLTGPGTQTFTGSLSYMTGSIFEWELNAGRTDPINPVNAGAYDKVIANGAVGGTSVFNVVLGSKSFADAFWSTNKTWTNIFSGTGSYDLASIFASITVQDVSSSGLVRGYGYNGLFQIQGNNLTWSPTGEFSGVPEPSSALAGLLLAAGLLRRRRG
jgi:autotransporter-associated beta strand protein